MCSDFGNNACMSDVPACQRARVVQGVSNHNNFDLSNTIKASVNKFVLKKCNKHETVFSSLYSLRENLFVELHGQLLLPSGGPSPEIASW